MPRHSVTLHFTAKEQKTRKLRPFLDAVGEILESYQPSLVRKLDDGRRITATYMVEANRFDDALAKVVGHVAPLIESGAYGEPWKIVYARNNGLTQVIWPQPSEPRVGSEPESDAQVFKRATGHLPRQGDAERLNQVVRDNARSFEEQAQAALDEAREAVDEALDS